MKRFFQKRIIVLMLLIFGCCLTGCKSSDYKEAQKLFDSGEYLAAAEIFERLEDYEDSAERANEAQRLYAVQLCDSGNYPDAITVLKEIEDYAPAQETLNETRIAYGLNLVQTEQFQKALQVFESCQENEKLTDTLDSVAKGLVAKGNYKQARPFLYLHDTNEEWMKDFLYQYLTWQMDNHDYDDTANTFTTIQGYKDTLTNDKFAGARLMSMQKVKLTQSEINIWSGGSVITLSLSFEYGKLCFNVSGGTISFLTYAMTNNVDISDSWNFYFDGKTIYIEDGEKFLKGGTIGTFNPATNDKEESVSLTLNLPGMMSVTNCNFERVTTG